MFKLINNFFNHSKNDLFKKNTLDIQKNFPVKKIFDAIKSFSDESDVYYVGGCVRKIFCYELVDDIDLATNINPDEVILSLKKNNISFYETGKNHGTITAMLFLLVGMLYDRAHHRWIVYPNNYEDDKLAGKIGFGGIANVMPIFSGFIVLTFFAGLGLPSLSVFISEALCFIGGFSVFKVITIFATLGILLNAVYFLRAYQRVFMGEVNDKYSDLTDISKREIATLVPLAIYVIGFGVYPSPLINVISPAMQNIIDIIQKFV